MGPTGSPTEIHASETVVLVGGGLGNAVLFSIGQAMRAAGSHVLYFAGYKKIIDRYKVAEIEAAADVVVWCCDEAPGFKVQRPGDKLSSAISCRRWRPIADGQAGRAEQSHEKRASPHRHRLRSHDGGRGRGAPWHAGSAPEPAAFCHRLDQLADAMHDEGDLRPVPATAGGPGDRRAQLTCSPASTRISRSIRWISPASPRGFRRTPCRKS